MTKATIFVSFKPSVFDPSNKVVFRTIQTMGYTNIKEVKSNKYFELFFDETDQDIVKNQCIDVCNKILVNTNIENYTIELERIDEKN